MTTWGLLVLAALVYTVSCQEVEIPASNCPPGFVDHDYFCYAYIDNELTWADAESTCAALGGFLPEIYNDKTNDFIKKMAMDHGNHPVWIGGEDMVVENTWTWSKTGVLIDGYKNWASGQPDDSFDHENCMELNVRDFGGKWNDAECDNKQRFVCQRDMSDNLIG